MPVNPERTTFSLDVFGRYLANTWQEAMDSADPGRRPEARPFDVVVIGGGTFGAAFAQHLFASDTTRSHRILVLEAGPLFLPEHVQNLPMLGVGVPGPTSIADLRAAGQDRNPREEVWGLAWHGNQKFPGLAYCLAGRSLYWGGWSPRLLPGELASWPSGTRADVESRYFREAAEQIGVNETNDFLTGPLHEALRVRLLDGLRASAVSDAVPLSELPLAVDPPADTPPAEFDLWKLEAPLAVQARARPGFFPFNKFSALPLLTKAARAAAVESGLDDVRKRLMVVPDCHVKRLLVAPDADGAARVTGVETNFGTLSMPVNGKVVVACGTIESARLALVSFADGAGAIPGSDLIGKNVMAHLRSNLTIRVPRTALDVDPALNELSASALFVKGRHAHADGTVGHFHLQITASGLGAVGTDSEAELFKKVPDLDGMDVFRHASDSHVVITIRGIGEMTPHNPDSSVTLDPESDEWGVRRAFAHLATSEKDRALWDAMDLAAEDVARVFAGTGSFERLARGRDGLGTTHHESGGLWMGDDPATSVTDADGRFHQVSNAYVLGPALLPRIGSPNPMLTGIALLRRTVSQVFAPAPAQPEPGFEALFDGTASSFARWRAVGAGGFDLVDGAIVARPASDLGLLFLDGRQFEDFTLRLEFSLDRADDNTGVFVRFRDPRKPVPDPSAPGGPWNYGNPAWVPVTTGFEIQVDELARPDGQDLHRTGAIYGVPIGTSPGQQDYRRGSVLEPGRWHELEIQVSGDEYTVRLRASGESQAILVTRFENQDPRRGRGPAVDPDSGYIGLQAHTGRVAFRNIRVQFIAAASPLKPTADPERLAILQPRAPAPSRTQPDRSQPQPPRQPRKSR